MYRARIGVKESAEPCPYHSQVPETRSFSNHQDNIVNERSDESFSPAIPGVSGMNLTRSVRRNFGFLSSWGKGDARSKKKNFPPNQAQKYEYCINIHK